MGNKDQREAMTAFLNTFSRGKRGPRGQFLADDVVANHWRWGYREIVGKEALIKEYLNPLLESFPDLDFKMIEYYMGDDFVVLRGEFNGTFSGPWAGCQPHGKPVRWKAHDIYEFKDGIDRYLKSHGNGVRDLGELIEFNELGKAEVMPYFGQEILKQAVEKGPLSERVYKKALKRCGRLSRK